MATIYMQALDGSVMSTVKIDPTVVTRIAQDTDYTLVKTENCEQTNHVSVCLRNNYRFVDKAQYDEALAKAIAIISA